MFLEIRRLKKRAKSQKKRVQNEDRNFEVDFSDFLSILVDFGEHFGSIVGAFWHAKFRRNFDEHFWERAVPGCGCGGLF